ncbi:HinT-interacting membrane complex protein P80 [Mycoplasma buteonis]|uniref:HinT-interacting membrane complex protein P80 n=1 Tax=Mycoplasma buteonis TaxID=171280 RepID=UPI0005629F50|nr:hypothetical protein [Mycoplasma buteonis]
MAKNKKSFFERLAEVNDQYDNKTNKKTTSKKKRNNTAIAIAVLLTAGVTTAIAVPLALNVSKVNYTEAEKADANLFSFNLPNGESKEYQLGNFEKTLKENKSVNQEQLDKIYREAVFYWYAQEQKASKDFQFRYNASLQAGDSRVSNIELKSLDEIRKQQKNKLSDAKLNLQKTYGFENWHQKFNELLLSEEYGKSKTEDEAVEFATFKVVEHEATRRFRIKVQYQSVNMLKNADKELKQINEGGVAEVSDNGNALVKISAGQPIFPFLRNISSETNLFNSDFQGMYYYNLPYSNQIVTISTESFIPEHMSFAPLVKDYLAKNNLGISTNLVLPGKFTNALEPKMELDQEARSKLANWFKYAVIQKDNKYLTESIFKIALDKQGVLQNTNSDFWTNSVSNNQLIARYNLFNDFLSTAKNETKVTEYNDFFVNNINQGIALLSDELFNFNANPDSLPTVSLEKLYPLPNAIKSSVDAKLEVINNLTDVNQISSAVTDLNTYIEQYVLNMSDNELQAYLSDNLLNNLVRNFRGANQKVSFAYKLSNQKGYLVVDKDKLVWSRRDNLSDQSIYDNLLTYLQNFNNNEQNDVIASVNRAYNKNILLASAFVDTDLINSLKNKEELKSFNFENLKAANTSILLGSQNEKTINALVLIDKWVKETKELGNSYNLTYSDGQIYLANHKDNQVVASKDLAYETIANTYEAQLKNINKGAK